MPPSDTSEKGLESLIVTALTGIRSDGAPTGDSAETDPVPATAGGRMPEPELDHLSNILRSFNDQFGNIDWQDADKIRQVIAEEIPTKMAADKAYQNAMQHSDTQNRPHRARQSAAAGSRRSAIRPHRAV